MNNKNKAIVGITLIFLVFSGTLGIVKADNINKTNRKSEKHQNFENTQSGKIVKAEKIKFQNTGTGKTIKNDLKGKIKFDKKINSEKNNLKLENLSIEQLENLKIKLQNKKEKIKDNTKERKKEKKGYATFLEKINLEIEKRK